MHTYSLKHCEHAQIEKILRTMEALDDLAAQLSDVPGCIFTNALLNVAVERLLKERGLNCTASALNRLAALLSAGVIPGSREAWPLSRADA